MTVFTPEVIASWPPPNYVDPTSLHTAIYVVNAICIPFSTLFMAGRLYARILVVKKGLGADDWIMLVAYFFAMALIIVHLIEPKLGIGLHIYDLKLSMLPTLGKIALIKQELLNVCVVLTRISICLSYLRLFPLTTNRHFGYCMIGVLIAYGIASGILIGAQCEHIEDTWKFDAYNSTCINTSAFYNWQTAMNAFFDLIVFLWPIRYLYNIKMPPSTRNALMICFSFGVVICAIALIRIWLTIRYYQTWDLSLIYMLVSVEVALGIICGCLPGIRPLVVKTRQNSTSVRSASGPSTADRRNVKIRKIWDMEDDLTTTDMAHDGYHEGEENHSLELEKQPGVSHVRQGSQDRIMSK